MRTLLAAVAVALSLALSAPACAQVDLQSLGHRYERAMDQENWREVVRAGEKIMELRPDLAVVPYNLACAHANLGDEEAAIKWLATAAENGFGGIVSIQTDPDLDPIRAHARFAEIEATVQARRDERFEAYCEQARSTEMLTIVPDGLDPETPAPLVVALHGSGGRAETFAEVYRDAAAEMGAVLVVPNGLRPAGNGGYNWTFRDEAEWMVMHAIERAGATHPIDKDRVVLTGFSMGANTTLEVGLKHPGVFAGLIPVCGHWDADVMAIDDAASDGLRVQLMIGARDEWAKTFREAHRVFDERGIENRLRVYQGIGHAYPANRDEELVKALRYVLGS